MSKILLTALFSGILNYAFAQNSYIKYFSEQDTLTWDDFQGISSSNKDNSVAIFYFGYRPIKEEPNDSVIHRLKAIGYLDKGLSFAPESARTAERLRFHQIQFKLLEIHRRELQKELDIASKKTDFDALFRNINATYLSLKNSFDNEYAKKPSLEVLQKWQLKTDSLLMVKNAFVKPASSYSPWRFGVSYGFGSGIFNGEAQNAFAYVLDVNFSLYTAYKKWYVGVNGVSRFFEDLEPNVIGLPNSFDLPNYNGTGYYDFWVGYNLTQDRKLEFMPQLGISTIPFQTALQVLEANNNKLFAGFKAVYPLERALDLTSAALSERNEFFITSIFLNAYISQYQFRNGVNSLFFQFSVGVDFSGGRTR